MSKKADIPLTSIIPAGKKALLKNLAGEGIHTLQECGRFAHKLMRIRGVGFKTCQALKEHAFREKVYWATAHSSISDMVPHFMSRYRCDLVTARVIAQAFFWDNSYPSSIHRPMF